LDAQFRQPVLVGVAGVLAALVGMGQVPALASSGRRTSVVAIGLAGFRMHRLGVYLQTQAVCRRYAAALPVVITALVHAQHGAKLLDGVRLLQFVNETVAHPISLAKPVLSAAEGKVLAFLGCLSPSPVA